MLESLQNIDAQWLLAINGMHNAFLDSFMWMVSKPYSWSLILLVVLLAKVRVGWKQTLVFVLAVSIAVLLADQISSGIIKHAVERLRPTHEPTLEGMVHIVRDYRGGMFGFVSSHAANAFAVAVLVGCMMPRRVALGALLAWACLQCYSRMYLGVHYPGDILGGIVVGVAVAAAVYPLWRWAQNRYCGKETRPFTEGDSQALSLSVLATVVIFLIIAIV